MFSFAVPRLQFRLAQSVKIDNYVTSATPWMSLYTGTSNPMSENDPGK